MEKAFRIRFTKLGAAGFLSHLELAAALSRGMIAGGISFAYSKGFHPHPKLSFADATSVGMESLGEFADIRILALAENQASLVTRINAALPAGVGIEAMRELPASASSLTELIVGFDYDIILPEDAGEAELLGLETGISRFLATESFPVVRETKGKTTCRDIRSLVAGAALERPSRRVRLSTHFGPRGTVRPAEFLTGALAFSAAALRRMRVVKVATRLADAAPVGEREIFSCAFL